MYIHIGLEFQSVNHTLIYENSQLNVFRNITFLGKILSNRPNGLSGTNVYNNF